jgi:hypothetical protein
MTLGESAVVPVLGGTGSGMGGAGLGIGGGVLGGLLAGGVGGALAGALLGNRNGGGWGNNGYGATPAAAAVATDIVLNPAFQSLQNQVEQLGDQLNTNEITTQIGQLGEQIANYNTNMLGAIGNVATAQAAANFTTLSSINGLGRDITAAQTQTLINNIQNFNQVQMSQQTATTQIISNLSAMAAQQASCCCEIKQLIQSDGNLTRALINDNTMQDLRDRNVTLAGEVSNFRQNQFLIDRIGGGSTVV